MQTAEILRDAEEFFHQKIPLTRAMGVRLVADSGDSFAIEAPVALNYNHLHTAFGGSINAVATLAAYGWLWLELGDPEVELVVAQSSIRFLAPVRETIRAICKPPAPEFLAAFHLKLRKKGRAKIPLHVLVEEGGIIAANFDGMFVAVRRAPQPPIL